MSDDNVKGDKKIKENDLLDDNYDDDLEDSESTDNQFLTFSVAGETYGIEILRVVEIIQFVDITDIPETHEYIKGIINLRGKIIPVMDIRLRFGMEEKPIDDRTCIIVSKINDVEVGIIVDSVSEVTHVDADQLEDMPDVAKEVDENFIRGIGKTEDKVIILINTDKLVQGEHKEKLEEISSD